MTRRMKDSGIEWIGEIPEDWEVSTVGRYCSLKTGTTPPTSQERYFDGDVSWFTPSDFNGDYLLIESNRKLSRLAIDEGMISLFPKQSILLIAIGATVGKIGYIDKEGYSNQQITAIIPKNINYKFLLYYMIISSRYIKDNALYTTLPIINNAYLKGIPLLIPPSFEKQKSMADFLDKKVSEIDNIISKTKEAIEEYKKYKQSLITEVVTKGLNKNVPMKDSGIEHIGCIVANWKVVKIKYLLQERNIRSTDGTEEPLSMSQKYGLIKTRDMDMIPNMASSFVGNKYVEINDLVFNKLKAHLGVFSVSSYVGIVSPDYSVYCSKRNVNINVKFLEYLFKTGSYINEFKKYSRGVGAGLTRLYTSEFFNIKCAIPKLEEQNLIVNFINKKCSQIDQIISSKEKLLIEMEDYKKSLIYEVVTGKREV